MGLFIGAAWYLLTQPIWNAQEPAAVSADPEKLRKHVEKLSVDFYPRNYREHTNLEQTADYIGENFRAAGGRVTDQQFTVGGSAYRNVIGSFGPDGGPRWIIGAHYDTHEDTPGADDNASGVAGLIELARMLGVNEPTFAVDLVAYPLEEPPFFASEQMGSAHHARSLDLETKPVRGVIVLEMIGYFQDEAGSQEHPAKLLSLLYPSTGNFLAVVGRWDQRDFVKEVKTAMTGTTELPIESIAAPTELPGIDFSDHRNYWPLGIPAVMVTDTAFYRNPHYHRESDTADTLDYERMAQAITAVYAGLKHLSNSED
ncbi:MAG: M28 family peptidase [Verrucomicrobiota bacterium]